MRISPDHWLQAHAHLPLPVTRESRNFFQVQRDIPSVNLTRLWDRVSKDPGLCLNFLKLAGISKKTRVTSVPHAMRMLGMPWVLALPDDLSLLEESVDEDIRKLITRAHVRACTTTGYCLEWTGLLHASTVEDTQSAGIVSELADYLVCCWAPDQARAIHELIRREGLNRDLAMQQVLGFTDRDLALTVAQAWSFPEIIVQALVPVMDVCQKARLVSLATRLSRKTESLWDTDTVDAIAAAVAEILVKAPDLILRNIHATTARCAREIAVFYPGVVPAAVPMLYMPVDKPASVVNIKGAPGDVLRSVLRQLGQHAHADTPAIMSQTFKGMTRGLGLKRAFFAVLCQNHEELRIRYIVSSETGTAIRKQRLLLKENRLLDLLMRKPQSLWVHDNNSEKYLPLISQRLRVSLNKRNFFIMSVFVKDKPLGLFYADRCDNKPLDEKRFKYFKLLGRETGQALAMLSADTDQEKIING
ncbi:MAG: HDOD domain-containing protein [Thiotrichales bacterium]|nr:HDOD domain-containing protein [Thiotrichales bacterium]